MTPGARIREARRAAGKTQAEVAAALGATQSVISDWENDRLHSWVDVAERLALLLGRPQGYFRERGAAPVEARGIDVIGAVQGGVFQLAVEWPDEDRFQVPVAPLPGYEGVQLRALKVVGPSVNQLYPDGSYVIVARAEDVEVREGDRVVVYRSHGGLIEATIKELRVEQDGRIALWPRSDHPEFQEPIYLEASDQDAPQIAFVVVGSFRQERRPPPRVQLPPRTIKP